jgi:hypothetical protein
MAMIRFCMDNAGCRIQKTWFRVQSSKFRKILNPYRSHLNDPHRPDAVLAFIDHFPAIHFFSSIDDALRIAHSAPSPHFAPSPSRRGEG